MMTIILDLYPIPEKGIFELNLSRSFNIRMTAEEARRQVNRWLLNEVSYLMGADLPSLVVGERVVWRVPVWISFPGLGKVGTVGTVDVDVETGEMNNLAGRKAEIERSLEELKPHLPLDKLQERHAPPEYVAKNVPPIPKIYLPEDEQLLEVAPL